MHNEIEYVFNLLENHRLKEALVQIHAMASQCSSWQLRTDVETLQTTYDLMLQYNAKGIKDPKQKDMYNKIFRSAYEMAERTHIMKNSTSSFALYYDLIRTYEHAKPHTLSELQMQLEAYTEDAATAPLIYSDANRCKSELAGIRERHEKALNELFERTWVSLYWTEAEAQEAQTLLNSLLVPVNDLCVFISAVTMSQSRIFDIRKYMLLLEAYNHPDPMVNQRAIVGIVITALFHEHRIMMYPEARAKLSLLNEDADFIKNLHTIQIQLQLSRETQKIDRKMREEIIPEMMRNVNIMRNMKFGFEETDENDRNPDWEQAFEQSGLGDKIREMNDLQLEGADVYMSTFAQLKGYPFFREPHNWFYPFDRMHSSIIHQVGLNQTSESSVLSIILQSGFFCNSDKYSFCFTIAQLPQGQRDMMLSQMTPQDQSDFMEEKNSASLKQYAERPDVISNQYIHDLYRFFKLSQRRNEFHNIFQEEIALHRNPVLKELLSAPELLVAVADFHFRKEHPAEALELYRILIDRKQANADIFQKTGFCLQKEKRYQEAVDAYLKADMLKPDHLWTLRHLATCYRQMKKFDAALEYYHRVETIQPENHNVLFYTASCLAEQKRYEDALQYFFKLDFLENNCMKAWRGIGWCSFVSGKHEQAMKYYDKLLASKPLATDYLNAGHVAWVLGNIEKAAGLYGKAMAESGSKDAFLEIFDRDRNSLLKQGIAAEEIPLMLDMIE